MWQTEFETLPSAKPATVSPGFGAFRKTDDEQMRTADLMRLTPRAGHSALDIGTRDGYFALKLASRYNHVTALDLIQPTICHPRISNIAGNVTELAFEDNSFEFILCAEVLEHIPATSLAIACQQIERVAGDRILIGVPFDQDTRVGRTTCHSCGKINPPWGHVSTFDLKTLAHYFPNCEIEATSFVGQASHQTNAFATKLMDFAGNPYGTYSQDEACIHCGAELKPPKHRNLAQKVATRLSFVLQAATQPFSKSRAKWMHVVFRKRNSRIAQ